MKIRTIRSKGGVTACECCGEAIPKGETCIFVISNRGRRKAVYHRECFSVPKGVKAR